MTGREGEDPLLTIEEELLLMRLALTDPSILVKGSNPELDESLVDDARVLLRAGLMDAGLKEKFEQDLRTRDRLRRLDEQDSVELNLSAQLKRYQVQYAQLPIAEQRLCTWKEVKQRLLKDGGHNLALAAKLKNGVLFSINTDGIPLIADSEMVYVNHTYPEARMKVLEEGLALFATDEENNHSSSQEVQAFERNLNRDFLLLGEEEINIKCWMESGESPRSQVSVWSKFKNHRGNVSYASAQSGSKGCGVMRILRLRPDAKLN